MCHIIPTRIYVCDDDDDDNNNEDDDDVHLLEYACM
jgi:hypothetical protein